MTRFCSLLFFLLFVRISGQQYVFGKVSSENNNEISDVSVINLNNGKQIFTDRNGNFLIEAKLNDELRFTKERYERASIKMSPESFSNALKLTLMKTAILIEDVEITYKPTGNLKEDTKHFGDKKKVIKLKEEVSKYILQKSDLSVILPKQGEFVQPVGEGFPVGSPNNKWDKTDFYESIISSLGKSYFNEIDIKNEEIFTFLKFALSGFDSVNVLKYGYYSNTDFMKIQILIAEKLAAYKGLDKNKNP